MEALPFPKVPRTKTIANVVFCPRSTKRTTHIFLVIEGFS